MWRLWFERMTGRFAADRSSERYRRALLTTLAAGDSGQARTRLREGTYRVRVTHPRYTPDTRRVHVGAGETAEVRIQLTPRGPSSGPPAVVSETTRTVHEGVRAVRRFFEGLAR